MTRRGIALLLLGAWLLACGKYGPPVRAGSVAAGGVVLQHAEDCNDPEHDHPSPIEPTEMPESDQP